MSYGVFRSFYRECESFRWTKVPRGAARDSAAAARERVTRFGLSIRFVEYTLGQIQILDGSVLRPLIILDRPLYQCTNTRMTRPIAPGWTYLAPQRSHGRVCVCMERGGREWEFKLGVGCWVLGCRPYIHLDSCFRPLHFTSKEVAEIRRALCVMCDVLYTL